MLINTISLGVVKYQVCKRIYPENMLIRLSIDEGRKYHKELHDKIYGNESQIVDQNRQSEIESNHRVEAVSAHGEPFVGTTAGVYVRTNEPRDDILHNASDHVEDDQLLNVASVRQVSEEPLPTVPAVSSNLEVPLLNGETFTQANPEIENEDTDTELASEEATGSEQNSQYQSLTIYDIKFPDDPKPGTDYLAPIFEVLLVDGVVKAFFECDKKNDKRRNPTEKIMEIPNQRKRAKNQLWILRSIGISDIKRMISRRLIRLEEQWKSKKETQHRLKIRQQSSTQVPANRRGMDTATQESVEELFKMRNKWYDSELRLFREDDTVTLLCHYVCAVIPKMDVEGSRDITSFAVIPYQQYMKVRDTFVEKVVGQKKSLRGKNKVKCIMPGCTEQWPERKPLKPHLDRQAVLTFICSLCEEDAPESQFKTSDHYATHFTKHHLPKKAEMKEDVMANLNTAKAPVIEDAVDHSYKKVCRRDILLYDDEIEGKSNGFDEEEEEAEQTAPVPNASQDEAEPDLTAPVPNATQDEAEPDLTAPVPNATQEAEVTGSEMNSSQEDTDANVTTSSCSSSGDAVVQRRSQRPRQTNRNLANFVMQNNINLEVEGASNGINGGNLICKPKTPEHVPKTPTRPLRNKKTNNVARNARGVKRSIFDMNDESDFE